MDDISAAVNLPAQSDPVSKVVSRQKSVAVSRKRTVENHSHGLQQSLQSTEHPGWRPGFGPPATVIRLTPTLPQPYPSPAWKAFA